MIGSTGDAAKLDSTMDANPTYELAGGDITLWLDDSGSIMLKVREPFGDPLELNEHEALELAELLTRLVKELGS